MKYGLFFFASCLALFVHAQDASGLITAERTFASQAIDRGLRYAFINNFDSAGCAFDAGKVYNVVKTYSRMKETDVKLLWHPLYAAVSEAGDVGFTTGPFEVRKSMDSGAIACGEYSTIWRKNDSGIWKAMVDLGTDFNPSFYSPEKQVVSFTDLRPDNKTGTTYHDLENLLIERYQAKGGAAFTEFITPGTWFNLQRSQPLTNAEQIQAAVSRIPAGLRFESLDGGSSASRDFYYVYGIVHNGDKKENYLRVWGHTSKGWRLLLQVLKW